MIDRKIILHIVNNVEPSPTTQLGENKKREWSRESRFIFFPLKMGNYNQKVNSLDAVQYLQRIRLLYTMLMRTN